MKWSNEEIKILENNYEGMSDEEIQNLLPNRTVSSISCKRKDMGFIRPRFKKYSYNDVIDAFSKRNEYILLSREDEFMNCNSKMRYICKKHKDKGEQSITLNHINLNRGCYYCGLESTASKRMINLDKEYDKQLCESNNFEYIDTIRENGKITIIFICNNHRDLGEQHMLKTNMERDIKGCKYCAGKELPEWYVLKLAEEINPHIKLLDPYKNLTTRMNCFCTKHNCDTRKNMQEILNGQGCYYCGIEKLSEMHFLSEKVVQDFINLLNPHIKLSKYNGNKEASEFYCTKHNKYFRKYYNTLLQCSSGCEDCYKENIRERQSIGIEEFKYRLNKIHPELIIIGEYINNVTPIKVYCKKHNYTYSLTPVALLNRKTCCDKTRITYKEEQVCKLLEEKWHFNITRQKKFDDCIDDRCLRFDIYLNDYNILIEFQGEQHYKPVKYSSETWDEANRKFEYVQKHDLIKKNYCKKHNISLIEIPYWEFEDLEYFLFDNLVKLKIIEEIKITA